MRHGERSYARHRKTEGGLEDAKEDSNRVEHSVFEDIPVMSSNVEA
jgi:hypothetical protein